LKHEYFDPGTRVIADLVKVAPGYYLVTRINVPVLSRSRGLGSKMLREILTDADAEGATLEIHPLPSGGLSRQQLIAWYGRYGFHMGQSFVSQDPVRVLIREPGAGGDQEW